MNVNLYTYRFLIDYIFAYIQKKLYLNFTIKNIFYNYYFQIPFAIFEVYRSARNKNQNCSNIFRNFNSIFNYYLYFIICI